MRKVEFSPDSKAIVDSFDRSTSKSGDQWGEERFNDVRKEIKAHYIAEQSHTCCFCRQRIVVSHGRAWDIEHIIPKSLFPEFMFKPINLCISCIDCNNAKGSENTLKKDIRYRNPPCSSSSYLTFHPHIDNYEEHLQVLSPGLLYKWRTSKGRKTITLYGLDRFLKVADRENTLPGDSSIRQLSELALSANTEEEYNLAEEKLLEGLLLKHRATLGDGTTLTAITSLKGKR